MWINGHNIQNENEDKEYLSTTFGSLWFMCLLIKCFKFVEFEKKTQDN